MIGRLEEAAAAGAIILPDANTANFVDMVNALASLAGVTTHQLSPAACEIADRIGESEHVVFVLVDGMGVSALDRLPAESFLRSHMVMELQSVFPATTACALTTLATGQWPAQHAVPGWWSYITEHDLSVTTLPFVERFSERSLEGMGLAVEDLWPLTPIMNAATRDTLVIQPEPVVNSMFSQHLRGRWDGVGYRDIPHAIELILQRVVNADQPTYTAVYLPEFDAICHSDGVNSERALATLTMIDTALAGLAEQLGGRARLVIAADHGQLDVAEENRMTIYDGDPILKTLYAPPTGDPRAVSFHVRDNLIDEFVKLFDERFGSHMALLTLDQVERTRLLGACPLSSLARRRFGNYIAIAIHNVTLTYYPDDTGPTDDSIGRHSGLSPQEMRIPLILA